MASDKTKNSGESNDAAIKELAAAAKKFLDKVTPTDGESPSKFSLKEFANTPFVVTVLGGVLLATVSGFISWKQADYASKAAAQAAATQKRIRQYEQAYTNRQIVLKEYIDQFPAAQYRLYQYVYTYAWINQHTTNSAKETNFFLGLSFTEMGKRLMTLDEERVESIMPESIIADVGVTYTNTNTLNISSNLLIDVTDLFNATNNSDVKRYNEEVNQYYDKLAQAMSKEIKFVHDQYYYEITTN